LSDRDETVRLEVVSEDDKAVILPTPSPTLPALPSLGGRPLRFASGEAVAPRAVPVEKPRTRARRRPRLDVFDIAMLVLIIVCTAVCVHRLSWAMQP